MGINKSDAKTKHEEKHGAKGDSAAQQTFRKKASIMNKSFCTKFFQVLSTENG